MHARRGCSGKIMARNSPDNAAIIYRREAVAQRYLRRQTMQEIATALEIGVGTVHRDITAVLDQWRAAAASSLDQWRAEELARCNAVEAEAWRAWERSCLDRTRNRTRKTESETVSVQAEVATEKRDGNPKFMEMILKCIDMRCKLLGVYPKGEEGRDQQRTAISILEIERPVEPGPVHGQ